MNILILYQHIDSGTKVATEALLQQLQHVYPTHNYTIYCQNPHRFYGRCSFLLNLIWSILDFRAQLNHYKQVKVVYATVYIAIIAQLLSIHRKTPVVFHLHGDHRFGKQKQSGHPLSFIKAWYGNILGRFIIFLQTLAIKKSTKTIFVAQTAQDEFTSRYHLEQYKQKFVVIHNGVSVEKYFPVSKKVSLQLKKTHDIDGFQHVVAYVGRIDEKKGIHLFIDSLPYLRKTAGQTTLLIIHPHTKDEYSHHYLSVLAQKVAHAQLPVRFIAQPAHIEQYYQLADCVVLPSEQEMLPLVILESLASGTPCLCTDVGGVREVLSTIPELLLTSVEPEQLAQQISTVLTWTKETRTKVTQQGLTLAHQYSWKRAAAKLNNVLCSTLSR